MKAPRRTLFWVYREIIRSRASDLVTWRMALARPWRIDLLYHAIRFRIINRRRRNAMLALAKHRMSPDWRSSLPKKQQRKLGMIPSI